MYYAISKSVEEHPSNDYFFLHNHEHYEIYMFLEGDSKYVVEENTYSLEPDDIIVIRKHEMHRVYHNSSKCYRRYVLTIFPEFFAQNQCPEYERCFTDFSMGTGNKISAELVRSSGLYNAFLRLEKYSDNFRNNQSPIIQATLIEILYLLNTITVFSAADVLKSPIKSVITYINNHYTENINLDELEKNFYISKYHLCRLFKHATGLTVHGYIISKRLIRACELRDEGVSLGDAASLAGFSSYSAFYRAYLHQYGFSPKNNHEI